MSQEVIKLSTYIPHIIGTLGTIFGTLAGVLLSHFINNKGKLFVRCEKYIDAKSKANEYAYNLQLFLHNDSSKPRYIRNINLKYYKKNIINVFKIKKTFGKKHIIENIPKTTKNEMFKYPSFGFFLDDYVLDIISLHSFETKIIVFRGLICNEDYKKLHEIKEIKLFYECESIKNYKKRKIRSIQIETNFLFDDVAEDKTTHEFPKNEK